MNDNLIAKKELLDTTGISYGSLYRWKRKNLIPDDWFIHRATFTGHETFFPKDKIIERINKILELKGSMSLDDISEIFNPHKRDIEIKTEDIENLGIASEAVINLYFSKYGANETYDYDSLLPLFIFSQLLNLGTLSRDEAFLATDMVRDAGLDLHEYSVVFLRKLGICTCLMIPEGSLAFYDQETSLIGEISISQLRSQLGHLLGVLEAKTETDERS